MYIVKKIAKAWQGTSTFGTPAVEYHLYLFFEKPKRKGNEWTTQSDTIPDELGTLYDLYLGSNKEMHMFNLEDVPCDTPIEVDLTIKLK